MGCFDVFKDCYGPSTLCNAGSSSAQSSDINLHLDANPFGHTFVVTASKIPAQFEAEDPGVTVLFGAI